MRKRYSEETRRRAQKFVRDGGSKSEAARVFGVALTTIHDWLAVDAAAVILIEQATLPDVRKALRLTQSAMARTMGVSTRRWIAYELGTARVPAYMLMAVSLLLAMSAPGGRDTVTGLVVNRLGAQIPDQNELQV